MEIKENSYKNSILIAETIIVGIISALIAVKVHQYPFTNNFFKYFILVLITLFQGLWMYRLYIVGHEASHRKLFMNNTFINDLVGSIMLLPLMTPINIYRKIHMFHHGFNRADDHTSALDTFTTKKITPVKKVYFFALWYINIFSFGNFIPFYSSKNFN